MSTPCFLDDASPRAALQRLLVRAQAASKKSEEWAHLALPELDRHARHQGGAVIWREVENLIAAEICIVKKSSAPSADPTAVEVLQELYATVQTTASEYANRARHQSNPMAYERYCAMAAASQELARCIQEKLKKLS